MQAFFSILLFIMGACFGSFLCCQARRLHLKNKSTKNKTSLGRRSVCLHCGYQLKWYDNLPLISWLILKGKCRKCHQKIGFAEILAEFGVGLAFLVLGLGMQSNGITIESLSSQSLLAWVTFIVALAFILIISFLAIYDGIYGQLPVLHLIISLICAVVIVILRELTTKDLGKDLGDLVLAVVILGGLYLLLYKISKGRWVGDGDWILGTALALALGSPWLALANLFLANFLACLVMFPIAIRHKNHKIYFGPFMAIAFVIVYSFSTFFCDIISLW